MKFISAKYSFHVEIQNSRQHFTSLVTILNEMLKPNLINITQVINQSVYQLIQLFSAQIELEFDLKRIFFQTYIQISRYSSTNSEYFTNKLVTHLSIED